MRKALVAVYGGGLAGRGTAALIRQSYRGLLNLARQLDIVLIAAWQRNNLLPEPTVDFALNANDNRGRHRQAREFADAIMCHLGEIGIKEAVIYSFGYTSFMPYGFQPYIRDGAVTFVWGDCSPPDTDELGAGIGSRFYGDAYAGTHGILYGWHEALPKSRVPKNLASYGLTMLPFSDEYVGRLRSYRHLDRGHCLLEALEILPDLRRDHILVVLASSDIWSPSAIGTWMTHEQHEGTIAHTRAIFSQLEGIGTQIGKQIAVLVDPSVVQAIKSENSASLLIIPAQPPPSEYRTLCRAAHLVIGRASHSVTSAECSAMGVPQAIVPMPAFGYMNVEDFTEHVVRERLALVPPYILEDGMHMPNLSGCALEALFGAIPEHTERAAAEFDRVHAQYNFFRGIEQFLSC